ncbi:hypothetical protein HDV62DRAFT_347763 [Trichoderma sp. SZMC 28011]
MRRCYARVNSLLLPSQLLFTSECEIIILRADYLLLNAWGDVRALIWCKDDEGSVQSVGGRSIQGPPDSGLPGSMTYN